MNEQYIKAKEILHKYNQEHVLKYLNQEQIIKQVLNIDFEEIEELYQEISKIEEIDIDGIEPIKSINPQKIQKKEIVEYTKLGKESIKNGKFAVAIMAGGQGTRLRT